jgi:hypothetical protein
MVIAEERHDPGTMGIVLPSLLENYSYSSHTRCEARAVCGLTRSHLSRYNLYLGLVLGASTHTDGHAPFGDRPPIPCTTGWQLLTCDNIIAHIHFTFLG